MKILYSTWEFEPLRGCWCIFMAVKSQLNDKIPVISPGIPHLLTQKPGMVEAGMDSGGSSSSWGDFLANNAVKTFPGWILLPGVQVSKTKPVGNTFWSEEGHLHFRKFSKGGLSFCTKFHHPTALTNIILSLLKAFSGTLYGSLTPLAEQLLKQTEVFIPLL